MSTTVKTGKCRISYANIFRAVAISSPGTPPGDPKYSASFLFDKKTEKKTISEINAAIEAAIEKGIQEKWGGKRPPASKLKLPFRDGDEEADEKGEDYEGMMFLNATSKRRPGIVDRNLDPIDDESEVYSGCYVRVTLNFYPFEVAGNRGVAVGINNIQKIADGEPLGGARTTAEADFDDDYLDALGDLY